MKYTIELSESGKFLRVTAQGEIDIDTARQWSADVDQEISRRGIKSLLNDVRNARNSCSVLEIYNFAYRDSTELHLRKNIRSAILTSKEDRSHDFVETTMTNAGYGVRKFTDESEAVNWLEEDF